MSFVRSGPRMLIVEPKDETLFRSFLISHFDHFKIPESIKTFEDIVSVMTHHQTLIYITKNAKVNITQFEIDSCVILEESCQSFLMKALNSNGSALITYVRRAPRIIIMKVIGSVEKTVDDIAEDFKATIESTKTILSTHSDGTVIFFTKGNINKKLAFSDFFAKAVYTTEHFSTIINILDHHALKYINRNTENKDWYDLTINIRDKYEDYKTHYDRLIYTLDCLGAGMVLKEGWSEETGRFFSTTGVYKLTLYTYLEPIEVKKILLALEYMENGERIIDFDLYYKKKKIHWDEVKVKGINPRESLSYHYRQSLYKSLDDEDIEYLRSVEDYIFASR
jgi:hypothetical protein